MVLITEIHKYWHASMLFQWRCR